MARYLNCGDTEPDFNSGDSSVVFCDDFEDGVFIDTAENPTLAANDGWEGNIGSSNCNAVSGGVGGTGMTATTEEYEDTQARCSGWHSFGPNEDAYNEIYHRFYVKFLTGYDFGHLKIIAYHHASSGFGNNDQVAFFHNPDGGNQFIIILMHPENQEPSLNGRREQNQGNDIAWTVGNWHYVEVRIKLDTPQGTANGAYEVWCDDVGADGLGDPGEGTLRLSYTNQDDIRRSNDTALGAIHQEFFLPQPGDPNCCGGGESYFDQIVIRTQRIGPLGTILGGGGGGLLKKLGAHFMIGRSAL